MILTTTHVPGGLRPDRLLSKVANKAFSEHVDIHQGHHLEGQGDLVSRLILGIFRVTIWAIGVINLLTKSP